MSDDDQRLRGTVDLDLMSLNKRLDTSPETKTPRVYALLDTNPDWAHETRVSRLFDLACELERENNELRAALEAAADWLYNPFEPDNQHPVYKQIKLTLDAARAR